MAIHDAGRSAVFPPHPTADQITGYSSLLVHNIDELSDKGRVRKSALYTDSIQRTIHMNCMSKMQATIKDYLPDLSLEECERIEKAFEPSARRTNPGSNNRPIPDPEYINEVSFSVNRLIHNPDVRISEESLGHAIASYLLSQIEKTLNLDLIEAGNRCVEILEERNVADRSPKTALDLTRFRLKRHNVTSLRARGSPPALHSRGEPGHDS